MDWIDLKNTIFKLISIGWILSISGIVIHRFIPSLVWLSIILVFAGLSLMMFPFYYYVYRLFKP